MFLLIAHAGFHRPRYLYTCGAVDRTSLVHVPAVTVQSNAPSNKLIIARDMLQLSLLKGLQMCHGSLAPLTWCGPPPGFVGSQLLEWSANALASSWEWC